MIKIKRAREKKKKRETTNEEGETQRSKVQFGLMQQKKKQQKKSGTPPRNCPKRRERARKEFSPTDSVCFEPHPVSRLLLLLRCFLFFFLFVGERKRGRVL